MGERLSDGGGISAPCKGLLGFPATKEQAC